MEFDCHFCDGLFKLNEAIGIASYDSIIYEDENVFIMPDLDPVVKGHFLIVTKKHLSSSGSANNSTFASLVKAKEHMKNCVFEGERILFFEHGAVIKKMAGTCIDHAHIHVIPFPSAINIDAYISVFVPSEKSMADMDSLVKCANENQPYIYYEVTGDTPWYYPVNWLPHQFFRMMVCNHFSVTNFRWRERYGTPESINSFNRTLQIGKRNNRVL